MKLSDFNKSSSKTQSAVTEENLQQVYDRYKNSSESELFSALMQEVASQKANGTFDFNRLVGLVNSLEGTMPKENFENIKRILYRLR